MPMVTKFFWTFSNHVLSINLIFFLFVAVVLSLGRFSGIRIHRHLRPFSSLVGFLCDRFNPRVIAFFGGVISTVALVVTSRAPNLTLMYFSYGILYGFGSSCVFFVVLIILQRYFIKRRSFVTGLAVTGPGGGLLIMSPVIQALLNNTSWRMTFMFMAAIVFLTCILSCSFDPNVATRSEPEETQRNSERELQRSSCLNVSYLRNKEYLVYLAASSTVFLGIAIPIVHLVSCESQSPKCKH